MTTYEDIYELGVVVRPTAKPDDRPELNGEPSNVIADCDRCGITGWQGDHPGQGAIVADGVYAICDHCADEAPELMARAHKADARIRRHVDADGLLPEGFTDDGRGAVVSARSDGRIRYVAPTIDVLIEEADVISLEELADQLEDWAEDQEIARPVD